MILSRAWLGWGRIIPQCDMCSEMRENVQNAAPAGAHSVVSDSLPHGLQSTKLLCPRNSLSKNTGVRCHFLLQGIFPTQGWNPRVLRWLAGSLPPRHLGSPRQNATMPQIRTPHPARQEVRGSDSQFMVVRIQMSRSAKPRAFYNSQTFANILKNSNQVRHLPKYKPALQ